MTTAMNLRVSAPRLVRLDEVVPQPWANGGGQTRELLAWPQASGWQVRVSVAEIDSDGPFSRFDDTQRWFAVLEGEGVELTIDGRAERVARGSAPLQFSGAADTSCRVLAGPTRDFNLMLRNVPGRMVAAVGSVAWRPALPRCGVFSAVAGRCIAHDGAATEMPALALLWFDHAPESLSFEATTSSATTAAWWLEAGDEGDAP